MLDVLSLLNDDHSKYSERDCVSGTNSLRVGIMSMTIDWAIMNSVCVRELQIIIV